jgi:hypothetical protein
VSFSVFFYNTYGVREGGHALDRKFLFRALLPRRVIKAAFRSILASAEPQELFAFDFTGAYRKFEGVCRRLLVLRTRHILSSGYALYPITHFLTH